MSHQIIWEICERLANGDIKGAGLLIEKNYQHCPAKAIKRSYNKQQILKIFLRDGFIDRYSGDKLVFPPVLRIISDFFPDLFPFHKNWKMSDCHMAYWQLSPTIDHIIPVARGGSNNEDNMVTTSMLRNSIKANWLLEEIGWTLYPPGKREEWDGLTGWFVNYARTNPHVLHNKFVHDWFNAVKTLL
jgi:hypothetical protein